MTIAVEYRPDVTLLKLHGDLVGHGERELLASVTGLLDNNMTRIVIDIAGVPFVNSAGLSELVQVTAQAHTRAAKVILANPSPFCERVLQTTKLDRFFDVADTVDEAVKRASGRA